MSPPLLFKAPSPLEYFAVLVAEDSSLAALEAAISIAQDEYPQLDVQVVLAEIDALALRLRARIPAADWAMIFCGTSSVAGCC